MTPLRNFRIVVICILFLAPPIDENGWRGIIPLHSTRTDVEQLVGSKVVRCSPQALSCLFDLGNETVFVLYAGDPTCKADDATTSWKVPHGTVIEITVRFTKATQFSDLGIDISKFEKTLDREFPSIAYYNNSNNGVLIEAVGSTIRSITYYGSAKDQHLSCKSAKDARTVKP